VANRVWRCEGAVEVHAIDQRVHREYLEVIPLGFDHRRIVANADHQPGWRRCRKV
jgi:hypothetical protein